MYLRGDFAIKAKSPRKYIQGTRRKVSNSKKPTPKPKKPLINRGLSQTNLK